MVGMIEEHYAAGEPSKSEQIRAALLADPDYPPARLAEDLGCSRALVHQVRWKLFRFKEPEGTSQNG